MQDVDRPAHVQALPQPPRRRGPRVNSELLRLVLRSQDADGISRHRGRRRDFGQEPAVRATEPELAVRLSVHLISLLVHGAVVAATEQCEIRERGGPAVSPVTDVMALTEPNAAPREAAATVSMLQRTP